MMAQKIYLTPYVGLGFSRSLLEVTSTQKYGSFTTPKRNGLVYGISVEYSKGKNTLGIAYKFGNSIIGTVFKTNTELTQFKNYYFYAGSGFISIETHNYCLTYTRELFAIYKSKKEVENKPRRAIKLLSLGSINLSRLSSSNYSSTASNSAGTTNGVETYRDSAYAVVSKNKRYGFNVDIGVKIQFYKYTKPRFALSVWYSQGFINRAHWNFESSLTNDNGKYVTTADLYTKASYLGVAISYPILLWSKKVK